ncbi:MAG: YerC/YecD family TrpR-related protein [bacterium]|nr:YerC/YecD family TrpR-related protein [bacterium]
MPKRRYNEGDWRKDPWFRALCSAISSCKNEADIADILRDIGTLSEIQAWSERLEVAKLLTTGLTYRQVAAKTGASTTTVTRVAKYLENGTGAYKKYLHGNTKNPDSITQRKSESMIQKYL